MALLHLALLLLPPPLKFSPSTEEVALTGLVKVDDEEAAAHAAGVVVLAAAREEGRAAEVALPAGGRSFAFPSHHVDSQSIKTRL